MRIMWRWTGLAAFLTAIASAALADDVRVTLGAGDAFSVEDNTGAVERLRLEEASGNLSRNGALFVHTTGTNNLFVGPGAGNPATTGSANAGFGKDALRSNTTAAGNSAFGEEALFSNTSGSQNSGFGENSLRANATGTRNNAFGRGALAANTAGGNNAGFGADALTSNLTGFYNSAFGESALRANTTGNLNSAFGENALRSNTTGSNNAALGQLALQGSTTGSRNVAVGPGAGSSQTTGSDNIYLANSGVAGESGQIRVGSVGTHTQATVAGIHGRTSASGIAVLVNASGTLGTTTSSGRFKQDVEDMAGASDLLMQLRPVTFRYRKEVAPDASDERQYGLIAEEVAEVAPELVALDLEGRPHSVKYHLLPALLLNQAQRDQRAIEALERRIGELERELAVRARSTGGEGGR